MIEVKSNPLLRDNRINPDRKYNTPPNATTQRRVYCSAVTETWVTFSLLAVSLFYSTQLEPNSLMSNQVNAQVTYLIYHA